MSSWRSFLQDNKKSLGIACASGLVIGAGLAIYRWRRHSTNTENTGRPITEDESVHSVSEEKSVQEVEERGLSREEEQPASQMQSTLAENVELSQSSVQSNSFRSSALAQNESKREEAHVTGESIECSGESHVSNSSDSVYRTDQVF